MAPDRVRTFLSSTFLRRFLIILTFAGNVSAEDQSAAEVVAYRVAMGFNAVLTSPDGKEAAQLIATCAALAMQYQKEPEIEYFTRLAAESVLPYILRSGAANSSEHDSASNRAVSYLVADLLVHRQFGYVNGVAETSGRPVEETFVRIRNKAGCYDLLAIDLPG
ncbi:hypothetical protein A3709_19800 [Halioglobus sp. HI00S01]|uniref:hypothetical protein n=1 Tax=Halioglobus sp. HI00S01 TaxID=1822214 RepID=UPI0007C3ADC6|nr:hypothetical protein [Halioglobus sp. HI00S01]KZX57871.1 hypothetical protein A3709_19800 [Halioglobus sp. HI00S01]